MNIKTGLFLEICISNKVIRGICTSEVAVEPHEMTDLLACG